MTDRPTDTLTLLFTDIEGSTRLWEQQPTTMQLALSQHDTLLRQIIAHHGGQVFKMVGDAVYAAFATTPAALRAALTAQRALAAHDWGALGVLRVRMALHTGAVEARDGDYFGPPLNRVARLLAAGHGGQILLSRAAQELTRDDLPADAELCDLGEHRLKDLIRPEQIFQLVVPDLPADFPSLRTLEYLPTNLPVQVTSFIGREREVAALGAQLLAADVRLLTLTGPGGTGKTRLALQVAANLLDQFRDGAWFVDLAPIRDPALVPATIARTLGVSEIGNQPILETLQQDLVPKQLLLVLDNFEQVISAATVVAGLLAAAPHLKVVVTSRMVLHLAAEHEFPVPPLALPAPRRLPPLERLTQYEAVRLFIQRAQAVKPTFQVTNANAPAVAELCVRLDGLPLAIELAAARIKLLSPQALLARLPNRLALLTSGARDLPARQQTLRATLDWSYHLLEPEEQRLFQRLAVFAGGRTLDAIEAICNSAGDLPLDPLDGMASLVDKNLVRQEEGLGGEPRFVLLETIHEYAWERLQARGAAEALRRRHAEFFLGMAETAEPELTGPQQRRWLDQLEVEHANLRAALEWTREGGESQMMARLAGSLWQFWWVHGHLTEGRRWLEEVLIRNDEIAISLQAKVLQGAGWLAFQQADYTQAQMYCEQSLAMWRELMDTPAIAVALINLGLVAEYRGDNTRAQELGEASLILCRELEDKKNTATVLNNLANLAKSQSNCGRAKELYGESLALYRELQNQQGMSYALGGLGEVARLQGDDEQATLFYKESLELRRALGWKQGIGNMLHNLGHIAQHQGEYRRAVALFTESLILYRELENKGSIATALAGLAGVVGARGQAERAATLFGAVEALVETTGTSFEVTDRVEYERNVATTCVQLDEEIFAAAWAEGRTMTIEQAITYALGSEQ